MKVMSYKDRVEGIRTPSVMVQAPDGLQSQAAAVRANQTPDQLLSLQADMAKAGLEPAMSELNIRKAGAAGAAAVNDMAVETKFRMAGAVAEQARNTQAVLRAAEDWFMKKQEELDAAAVMQASNEWRSRMLDYEVNPETGYKNSRQLGGAVNLLNDTKQKLDDTEKEISKNLSNDRQRKAFSAYIMQNRSAVEGNAARFEADQIQKNTTEVTKQTIQSSIASAIEHPEDFETYFSSASGALLYSIKNTDNATKARAVSQLRSDFQAAMIASTMDKDPIRAEQYFNAVKGELAPDTRIEMAEKVRAAAIPEKAKSVYAQVGGDLTKGIELIQANVAPAEQKQWLSAFRQEFSIQEAMKQDQREKVSDQVVDMANDKLNYNQIKSYIKQNEALLGPKEYRELNEFVDRDYERGKYAPSPAAPKRDAFNDLLVWTQAKEELAAGKYSSANEFFKAYKGALPPGTLRSLATAAFYGKDPKTSTKDKYDKYNPLSTVGVMISDYQIDMDPREEQDFWAAFSDEAHARENEKKRKLTSDEIEGVAKDLLKKTVLKKDYNNAEKAAMSFGIGKGWFKPDEVTEGYVYQQKAAYKKGVHYDAGTDTYYQVDGKGNITGYLPDSSPKLKSKDKRKIQGPGFYDE